MVAPTPVLDPEMVERIHNTIIAGYPDNMLNPGMSDAVRRDLLSRFPLATEDEQFALGYAAILAVDLHYAGTIGLYGWTFHLVRQHQCMTGMMARGLASFGWEAVAGSLALQEYESALVRNQLVASLMLAEPAGAA